MFKRTEEQSSIENSMRAKPAVGHSRLRLAINLSRSASSLSAIQFNRPALPKHKKQKGRLFKHSGGVSSYCQADRQLGSNRLNPSLAPISNCYKPCRLYVHSSSSIIQQSDIRPILTAYSFGSLIRGAGGHVRRDDTEHRSSPPRTQCNISPPRCTSCANGVQSTNTG